MDRLLDEIGLLRRTRQSPRLADSGDAL